MGYTDIKIYNGGLKDWKKSGYEIVSISKLPSTQPSFIDTEAFFTAIKNAEDSQCLSSGGEPVLTILDLRNGNHLDEGRLPRQIDTACPSLQLLLDDLLEERKRDTIPRQGDVITITETGNRDEFVIRYLSQFGYSNIRGLKFGMRGWLKQRYPTR